ncbi:MAG: glycosyltransferase family 4 protein [bacterium]
MKRLLVFSAFFYPHIGGYERNVQELCARLVCQGFHVDLITCNTNAVSWHEVVVGVSVYRLPCWNILGHRYPIPRPAPHMLRLLAQLASDRYCAVTTQTRFFPTSFLGLLFAKLTQTPLIHVERGSQHSTTASRTIRVAAQAYDHTLGALIVRSARYCVGVSQAACEFLTHLGAKNTYVIHNGIAPTHSPRLGNDWRVENNVGRDVVLVSFVGRLIYAKGVQDLIRAFARIKPSYPKLTLVIVGDGPYRGNLEALAGSVNHHDDVLLVGEKDHDEVFALLEASDIFVNPSYSEGLPTSVMEAAIAGVPIIATDIGGTREIIKDDTTGILVEPSDVQQLANRLEQLASDYGLRQALGASAREHVKKEFRWEGIAEQWAQLLDRAGC